MTQNNRVVNPEIYTPGSNESQSSTLQQPVSEALFQKKPSKIWLIPSLIGLIVIAFGIAGYFAYQNVQFKKGQVQVIQPTQIPITSITPKQEPPQITDIEQSVMVFEKDGKIFLLNGLGFKAVEIDEGSSHSLSSDQKKLPM